MSEPTGASSLAEDNPDDVTLPLRVLLVEDSEDDAELELRELQRAGYDVVVERVETAEAMRAALDRTTWDIVLSDYMPPRFGGLQAFAVLQGHAVDLPFIIVSGTVGEETAVEAMRAGVADYVHKDHIHRLVPIVERTMRDWRARQRANDALRDSERQFRAATESANDAIISIDAAGRVTFWNPAAESIFGYAQQGVLGRSITAIIPERYREAHRTRLQQLASGDEPRQLGKMMSFEGLRKDGSEVPVEVSLATWDRGGSRHYTGVVRDISERSKLEAQLRQAQKMEAVGRLAGGVAHDFNNALAVIQGCASFVLEDLPPGDAARQDLEAIQAASDRAAALTRQLLAFSRKQVQRLEVLDLHDVVGELHRMLQRVIGEDISLGTSLSSTTARVKGDRSQLEQVLLNLAVNAKDAMPHGGRLTIETADVELGGGGDPADVDLPPGRYVMLAVTDTGTGIDAETREHLFDPFYTTKEKGAGLGLSTVYGIVKQSGGTISCQSEPGRGTTFTVYLPCAEAFERAAPKPAVVTDAVAGTVTILLVEDDDQVRRVARRILEKAGYSVLEVARSRDAVETCARHSDPVRLLLTDVVMPDLNGVELAARLRQAHPAMRVVYMSGYTGTLLERQGAMRPDDVLLPKPFTNVGLLGAVRRALEAPAPGA